MRITGGKLKGLKIPSTFASHVRPTTDMMREAVFNKLHHTVGIDHISALDLFTGSGSVAIEFVSRGAQKVVAVDRDPKNISSLKSFVREKNLLSLEVVKQDVFRFLKQSELRFDVIYADPPYDMDNMQELADLAIQLLKPGGLFLLEHRPGRVFSGPVSENRNHGSTSITIFAVES